MNTTIRTFRAAAADEAIAQVRREMGLDAVVLEVKQVTVRGWFSSKTEFEVQATRAAAATGTPVAAELAPPPALPETVGSRLRQVDTDGQTRRIVADVVRQMPTAAESRMAGIHAEGRGDLRSGVSAGSGDPRRDGSGDPRRDGSGDLRRESLSIEQRLDALQQMIADLGRRTLPRGLIEIPPELFPHYMTLVEADVDEQLARELIQELQQHAAPGQLADTSATMALITALMERRIPCDRVLNPVPGRRQIAMVVGPTGVGKTTTLAKLAGRFGMQDNCRIGLITVDTYRVAAVEQLRTYAEIIDLPMKVVTNATQMQEALDSFIDCDLVLIDTAGRSPNDEQSLAELKQLVEAACPDHIYLVLSLSSGATALRTAAERFACVHPTSLVMTKLDEASGCGGLLSVARNIGLPMSYFTTGQEVPRDIEPANPCRAARLIVGTDSVQSTPARCASEGYADGRPISNEGSVLNSIRATARELQLPLPLVARASNSCSVSNS
ncbi:MAG: flagellar biosynthesis protein FlhF [Planctomycetes bacterium]|nr:flagellar biosynthesis protein FlhF [Planctomycetota bacterium]